MVCWREVLSPIECDIEPTHSPLILQSETSDVVESITEGCAPRWDGRLAVVEVNPLQDVFKGVVVEVASNRIVADDAMIPGPVLNQAVRD